MNKDDEKTYDQGKADGRQGQINEEYGKAIDVLRQHAETANREVGEVKIFQAEMRKDIGYLKDWARENEKKVWLIIFGVGGLILKIIYDISISFIKK